MRYGRVSGSLWATRKDEKLQGWKLMLVDIIDTHTNEIITSIVAADNAGAGIGDFVLVAQGSSARVSAENANTPIDAMIIGVVDSMEKD